ncbi:MAG: glutamyl-tRNA reductase [Actinomycetota bacterium]|nr:glutamyl-tRNA reductase [Actinomycetota bacterium]
MSIVVVGVNHRTGPLSVLERVAVPVDDVGKAVATLVGRDTIREVVVLSTCNRTEIYAVAEKFHGAYADLCSWLCAVGDIHPDDLNPHLYTQHDDAAVNHLFSVAAGLESAVLGESEILGQVREAWTIAAAHGGAGATLNQLFRHAVRVGKRARSQTAIGRHTASVSHAAVDMIAESVDRLADQRVLIVGAGLMGERLAKAFADRGVSQLHVVNRDPDRARRLAASVGATSSGLDQFETSLADADVVVACTGATTPLITPDTVGTRVGVRPLHIVDIAVPRDVDVAVGRLPGVTVVDLDDLRDWADRGLSSRAAEADGVRSIVTEEVDAFQLDTRGRQAAPLVAALRHRAESLAEAEMARYSSRLATMSDEDRRIAEALVRGLVAKFLHEPSVRLSQGAGSPRGERNAAAVRDLFDLD